MEIAARFLATRPRTRWEVERRLRRADAAEPVVDATLERLAKLGYVDDAAFARWWGEQRDRHAPRGQRLIESELRRHGVAHEVIEAYRREHDAPQRRPEDEALPGNEADRAREALAAHLRGSPVPEDPRARQRAVMFLARRGFDPDAIRTALRELGASVAETE